MILLSKLAEDLPQAGQKPSQPSLFTMLQKYIFLLIFPMALFLLGSILSITAEDQGSKLVAKRISSGAFLCGVLSVGMILIASMLRSQSKEPVSLLKSPLFLVFLGLTIIFAVRPVRALLDIIQPTTTEQGIFIETFQKGGDEIQLYYGSFDLGHKKIGLQVSLQDFYSLEDLQKSGRQRSMPVEIEYYPRSKILKTIRLLSGY